VWLPVNAAADGGEILVKVCISHLVTGVETLLKHFKEVKIKLAEKEQKCEYCNFASARFQVEE